jgi:ferrochelatase
MPATRREPLLRPSDGNRAAWRGPVAGAHEDVRLGSEPAADGAARSAARRPAAILLMAHGGPATPAEVPGFIRDMLGSDAPDGRVAAIEQRYRAIGGASPLPDTIRAIGASLARAADRPVYVGMRYGRPSVGEALTEAAADGTRLLAAVYLNPHLPAPTAGWCRESVELCARSLDRAPFVRFVGNWHRRPEYLAAEAAATRVAVSRFARERRDGVSVVFSAHSLPMDGPGTDDQYDRRVRESAFGVAGLLRLPADRWCVAYQSAPTPGPRWLGPHLRDVVAGLASRRERDVAVVPLGFVADSLEVLYDIDLELTRFAAGCGVHLERAPLLNDDPGLVDALKGAVREALAGDRVPKESL